MHADYTFAGPSFDTQLSPPDQAAVYTWSPRILIFSLPPGTDHEDLISTLREGIQNTVQQFPDLAGSCTQPPTSRDGDKQGGLRYHDKGAAHLRVRDLSAKYDMEELRAGHFSQDKLLPEDLCPTPAFDHPAMHPLELFSVQANFIKSGLLLVVCIYHSISDGVGQFHITEMLANQCHAIGQRKASLSSGSSSNLRLSFSPQQFDRSRLFHGASDADPATLSCYSVLPSPPRGLPAWAMPDGRPIASATFLLRKAALTELKALASQQNPSSAPSATAPYISTHDAVCALIWRSVMAARLQTGAIAASATTTFGMPIDGRSQLTPPLPADFLGNIAVCFKVGATVRELVAAESLGAAAFQIRAGVRSVDDAYLRTFIGLLQQVPDVGQVSIDCLEHIKSTGLFLTSWAKFDYSALQWGPGFGECEGFRFPSGGYVNGIAVVFPPLRNGDWEVTLTLEATEMEALRKDPIWMRFVSAE
ncbi:hypothetical protein MMC13_002016 [Lambiella insularis]|nr:hypothetical protein [Lambiella insularis]